MAFIDRSRQVLNKNLIITPASTPYNLEDTESGALCCTGVAESHFVLPTINEDNVGIYYYFISTDQTAELYVDAQVPSGQQICLRENSDDETCSYSWNTINNENAFLSVQSIRTSPTDYNWTITGITGKWQIT